MIPPNAANVTINARQETRIIWMVIDGRLSSQFLQQMGAVMHRPMKQGALPSQMKLARHIVQATVRIQASQEGASAQLQQLLWELLLMILFILYIDLILSIKRAIKIIALQLKNL